MAFRLAVWCTEERVRMPTCHINGRDQTTVEAVLAYMAVQMEVAASHCRLQESALVV